MISVCKSTLFFFTPQRGLLDNEIVHLPRGQHVVTPTMVDENDSDKCVGLSRTISAKRRKLTYDAVKKIKFTLDQVQQNQKFKVQLQMDFGIL